MAARNRPSDRLAKGAAPLLQHDSLNIQGSFPDAALNIIYENLLSVVIARPPGRHYFSPGALSPTVESIVVELAQIHFQHPAPGRAAVSLVITISSHHVAVVTGSPPDAELCLVHI
jgi:hypothetical protein